MRAWFSAHMSASVQLEPPADGAGGDAPVGLLDPTHVFGIQAFSSSSRSQGRIPGVGSGGGDEGLHQRRSRCMQLGCWRELQGSAEVVGVGVGVGVWQPSLLCIKDSTSTRAKLDPLARSWSQGKKLAKISYLSHVRVCGRFGRLEPFPLLTHPIPSHLAPGIWGFAAWPLTRSRRSRGLACSLGSQQEKYRWSIIRIRPARCVPRPPTARSRRAWHWMGA